MKATEILAKSQAATASLIQKGTKGHKESIYKSAIFEGLSDKEKKSSRKKIRNYVQSLLSSALQKENLLILSARNSQISTLRSMK